MFPKLKRSCFINSNKQTINYKIVSKLDKDKTIYNIYVELIDTINRNVLYECETSFNSHYSLNQLEYLISVFCENKIPPTNLHNIINNYMEQNPYFIVDKSENIVITNFYY